MPGRLLPACCTSAPWPPLIHYVGQGSDRQMTLAERFAIAKGGPIVIDGIAVQNMFRRAVVDGQRVGMRFIRGRDLPPQGIRFKVKEGTILLNGQTLGDAVVWQNSAPTEFEFVCCIKKGFGELRIWNCWLTKDRLTQAWIGNAGMVIEDRDNRVLLKCSPGIGDFDPQALEVELAFL